MMRTILIIAGILYLILMAFTIDMLFHGHIVAKEIRKNHPECGEGCHGKFVWPAGKVSMLASEKSWRSIT